MSPLGDIFMLVLVLIILCWWMVINQKDRIFLKNIVTPPGLPFLGHALQLRDTKKILDVVLSFVKTYGGVVNIQIGPAHNMVVLASHESVEAVLSSQKLIKKSIDYNYLRPWLGNSLLTSEGQIWKNKRRLLTPAFHFSILENFIEIFQRNGDIMIECMRKKVKEDSVDIYPIVTLCALDIICESAMGTQINAQLGQNTEYVKSVKEMCRIIVERSISPFEMHDFLYRFSSNYTSQKKCLKVLHDYTNGVINKRREALSMQNDSGTKDAEDEFGVKSRKAFLDILLDARIDGKPLEHREIREEVDTFMFEGHDTTASGVSFALYSLAEYPEVQDKVYEEQKAIFSSADMMDTARVTLAQLQEMKYLENVIKEVLRFYPSVPVFAREMTDDVPLPSVGATIPKGSHVLVFPYCIHRNPKYFKDPETFNPDRFAEEIDGSLPYAYVPFSAGPRNCIGQKFAMLEMKSTISKVVRNFILSPSASKPKPILACETILKSANGFHVQLRERNHQ